MSAGSALLGAGGFRSRSGVVVVSLALALLATTAVFLYVRADRNARGAADLVGVVVATRDIPAGAVLDDMIADGGFVVSSFPSTALVRDAVTDLDALTGTRTAMAVLEGQQISSAFIEGDPSAIAGGSLGIPEGMEAISIALEPSRVVAGDIVAGDNLTVYASFGAQTTASASGQPVTDEAGPVTVVLVKQAEVLKVIPPDVNAGGGPDAATLVTLALKPFQAQRLIYSQENGSVWLGLLPPDQNGRGGRPLRFSQVVK